MALIYFSQSTGDFRVRGSKHAGQALLQVAEEDLGYLEWVWKKGSEDLDDNSYYALEDVLLTKGSQVFDSSRRAR